MYSRRSVEGEFCTRVCDLIIKFWPSSGSYATSKIYGHVRRSIFDTPCGPRASSKIAAGRSALLYSSCTCFLFVKLTKVDAGISYFIYTWVVAALSLLFVFVD